MSKVKRLFGGGSNREDEVAERIGKPKSAANEQSKAALIQENTQLKQRNTDLLQRVHELEENNEKINEMQLQLGKQVNKMQTDLTRFNEREIWQNLGRLAIQETENSEEVPKDVEREHPGSVPESKGYCGPGPECRICAGTAPINPKLCNDCQFYNDARHALYCKPGIIARRTDEEDRASFTLQDIQRRQNCIICEMVALAVSLKCKGEPASNIKIMNGGLYSFRCSNFNSYIEVVGAGNRVRCIPMEILQPKAGRCAIRCLLLLLVGEQLSHHFNGDWSRYNIESPISSTDFLGIQLVLHYTDKAVGLHRAHPWENSFLDVQAVLEQLHICQTEHKGPCQDVSQVTFPPGFRLIDVYRRCVVQVSACDITPRYVALSYPWASREHFPTLTKANVDEFERDDTLGRHNTPQVVWNAVTLCFQMGERYLWVDRLCILQDDATVRRAQIMAMDAVYRGASMTIVDAADPSFNQGLPGVLGNPRPPHELHHWQRNFYEMPHLITPNADMVINQSLWNTRAWTFQERLLSRRCIFVSEQQVYFVCADRTWEEEFGYYRSSPTITPLTKISNENPSANNVSRYYEYIEAYSARDLTVHTDILNAFAGVSNVLSSQLNTAFHFGLPEKYLLSALIWTHVELQQRRTETIEFPTYTWAGWMGSVKYQWDNSDRKKSAQDFGTLAKFFISEGNKRIRRLDIEDKWFGSSLPETSTEPLPAMDLAVKGYHDQVWDSRSTGFWQQMIQNPWTYSHMISPDDDALTLAANYPGALVWKTTAANLRFYYDSELNENSWVSCNIRVRDSKVKDVLDPHRKFKERLADTDVGQTFPMQASWLKSRIKPDEIHHPCEVIVLCAALEGMLRENFERDFSQHELVAGYLGGTNYSPWQLVVMLVERDKTEPMICRRLALGTIEARCWRVCEPEWKTIVLI